MAVLNTVSRYRWVILAVAVTSQITATTASQVLPPLAPLFMPDLHLSKTEVGLFSSACYAGAWSTLLVAGSATDRFGVRWMMIVGQVVTGSLLLSMSIMGSFLQAAGLMFLVGVGRAVIFPGSTKMIMEWFPPAVRATALGLKQTGGPVAGIAAAAILPAVGLTMGWRFAIALSGLVILGLGVLTGVLYRDPPKRAQNPEPRPSLRTGIGDVVRNRRLWLIGLVATLFVMAQQSMLAYLALYFKEVVLVDLVPQEGARIVAAGFYLAACQFGGVVGRISWGWVSDRLFRNRRIITMAIIGVLAATMMLLLARLDSTYPAWLLSCIVFLCGITAVGWNGVFHALVAETAGRRRAASAVGLTMTQVEVGTMVGPPLFGLIVDSTGSYSTGLVVLACLSLSGTVVAAAMARAGAKAAPDPPTAAEGAG